MSGYIGTQPVPQATQTRDSFTCTAGQTSFATSGYTPGFLDVYLNGIKLAAADYTASNGSDVVLASGAALDDILEVVAYTSFEAANVTGATDFTVTGSFTSRGIDDNATSTAMTLDTSGNVLVGKTTTGYNSGTEISYEDFIRVNRTNGSALYVGRNSSDGELVSFRKDGSTVGSIGTLGSRMSIGTGDVGLFFNDQTDQIQPINTSTNAPRDAAIDLGATDRRFKDAYLSGGIYLGGTGAANYLDDYEEGTFIPTFQSITNPTYVVRVGYYIKIGSFVSYQYRIEWSAGTSIGSTVNGLPFAARNGQDEYPMTSNVYHDQGVTYSSSRTTAIGYVLKNTANMDLVCIGSAQTVGSLTFSTSGSIYVTGQYYTNS